MLESNMNKEDYVSLEVAKLLKEKGFDEPCDWIYDTKEQCFKNSKEVNFDVTFTNSILRDNVYCVPTLYEAQKWLREKHNIDVLPIIREESLPKKDYCCYIYKNAKVVSCKVAYGEDFYECMNDSLFEAIKMI